MMKRMLSLLLSFCLVAGLFAGMTATAYADGDTQEYYVQSGDTLLKICDKLGVDYFKNKEWIVNTNKLKSPDKLTVNQKLILPARGKVLTWVEPTTTAATTTTDTISTPTVTTTAATTSGYSVPVQYYTLKNGDFVSTVCKNLGVDFAANDAWIRAANNITNYNNLKVGRVLVLPAKGTTPPLSTATPIGTTTTATTIAATTTTTGVGLLSGDTVSYYLFDYVVRSGDTLFNICNSVGANMETVQKLNNITNAAALRVGQVLSIPSAIVPASGSYVRIVAHKVVSGDTVQGICKTYGVDYGKNLAKIKALNNRDNLDVIKVGQTILIPVAGAVTTTTTGTTATTISTGTVVSSGTTGTVYYTLNQASSMNGTYSLTVNGQSVNGASAGQTVHVVATPDHGYMLSSNGIVVKKAYGTKEAVKVDANNNFVMPACNVEVSVSFTPDPSFKNYTLKRSDASAAVTLTYVVNGYSNTEAQPGQTVSLVLGTLASGYSVGEVYVTTVNPTSSASLKNGSIAADKFVAVSNMSFKMPASDVYVTVLLKGA